MPAFMTLRLRCCRITSSPACFQRYDEALSGARFYRQPANAPAMPQLRRPGRTMPNNRFDDSG